MSPAIPKSEAELKELIEDLTRMGCKGLLAKPWSLQSKATLREFLFERGNQWFMTMGHDPGKWTAEVWAEVYGFTPRKGEGWASRNDSLSVGKFRGKHNPKDGFHPGNCWNKKILSLVVFCCSLLNKNLSSLHAMIGFVHGLLGECCSPRENK